MALVPIQVSIQQPLARALLPDLKDASLHGAWLNWQTAQDNLGTDYSVAGDDMTPVGAPTAMRVGADFDGAADYLRRAEANWRIVDEQGTISAWVKRDVIGGHHTIFHSADGTSYQFILLVNASNAIEFYNFNAGAYVSHLLSIVTLNANEWYHIAVVSNGTSYQMYLNGAPVTFTVPDGADNGAWLASVANRTQLTIGARRRGASLDYYLNGQVMDIRYYSKAKSADWVKYEFERGVPDDSLLLHLLGGCCDLSRYERALVRGGGVVTGHDMEFDGVDDVIDCGDLGNVQTIMGWVRPGTTTEEIWLVDAGNDVMVSGGTVTYAGLTPVATYVNGVAGTAMAAGVWQHLACVVETVDANNFELGTDGTNFGLSKQRDVKVFSAAKAAAFIKAHYIRTRGFY